MVPDLVNAIALLVDRALDDRLKVGRGPGVGGGVKPDPLGGSPLDVVGDVGSTLR